ncbi:hypothetical protein ACU1JV_08890 [Paenibacillus sp. T2-29]|nr:hypothetical protein [Paenibacillus polymyxa]
MLSKKRSPYVYDMLDLVDELRFKQDMTVKELTDALRVHGIS